MPVVLKRGNSKPIIPIVHQTTSFYKTTYDFPLNIVDRVVQAAPCRFAKVKTTILTTISLTTNSWSTICFNNLLGGRFWANSPPAMPKTDSLKAFCAQILRVTSTLHPEGELICQRTVREYLQRLTHKIFISHDLRIKFHGPPVRTAVTDG